MPTLPNLYYLICNVVDVSLSILLSPFVMPSNANTPNRFGIWITHYSAIARVVEIENYNRISYKKDVSGTFNLNSL
jgi:hypothetical protein